MARADRAANDRYAMENWTREDSVAALELSYRRRGGRARTIIWMIGVPLLVGAIAVAGYMVSQSKLNWNIPGSLQNLTAGIMSQPSASPRATLGAPPPLPPSSAPTTPASSTTPGTDDPAVLFAAFVADPTQSYHVEIKATAKQDGQTVTITMSADESGTDFGGQMTLNGGNQHASDKFVVKNGTAYAKVGSKGWVATTNLGSLDLPSGGIAFGSIEQNTIQFLGREAHGGQTLNHIRALTSSATGLSNTGGTGCQTKDLPWDIWVRDNGQPISATFDYSCTVGGSTVTSSATYQFTRVGKPVDIVPPQKFTWS